MLLLKKIAKLERRIKQLEAAKKTRRKPKAKISSMDLMEATIRSIRGNKHAEIHFLDPKRSIDSQLRKAVSRG